MGSCYTFSVKDSHSISFSGIFLAFIMLGLSACSSVSSEQWGQEQAASVASISPAPPNAPYGIPVPDRPGFVHSPYSDSKSLIDVRGLPPNTSVTDPWSGKIFLVPRP